MPPPEVAARLIFEAAEQLGWGSDAAAIAERVRGLERGLPAEDELMVLLHWLGRCRLVHKLDQAAYPPNIRADFRVSDLFAVFRHNEKDVSVYIEVKVTENDWLSWTPAYIQALRAYGELTGTPVLVAWKRLGFWMLVELRHFRPVVTNLALTFRDAMRNSLMGVLAGDFSVSLQPAVGTHLSMRKLEDLGDGRWHLEIDDAYHTDRLGGRHGNVPGLMALLMCIDHETTTDESDTHFTERFVVQTSDAAEMAHRCLVKVIEVFASHEESGRWRGFIQGQQRLPALVSSFRETVEGLMPDFVHHIINFVPVERPQFLS